MKKVYNVWIEQRYIRYQQRRIERGRRNEEEIVSGEKNAVIFAENLEDAKIIYQYRYKTDYDYPIDYFWRYGISAAHYDVLTNTVKAQETNWYTFNQLKEKMTSDDFMEYCAQWLYPIIYQEFNIDEKLF